MDEMPKLNKTFLFMCYTLDGNELCADSFYNDEKIDWPPPYWIEVEDMIEEKIVAHPFCWAYTSDLAAVEFNRMLMKETAQDAPSIRYVGAGGSGYGRTGFGSAGGGGTSYSLMGGSGSGGSSHGSSFSSVGGLTESHDWQSFKVKLTEVV